MLDNLTQRLSRVIKTIRGEARLTESNIQEALREVRMALLEADVALPVVRDFVARVKEKALGHDVSGSLTPGQALVGVVHAELTALMGGESAVLDLAVAPPAVILMAGLQGSGKTTTTGKLAKLLLEDYKKKPLLVSCDVYRPAAIEQLATIAEQVGVDFFPSATGEKPLSIALAALDHAKRHYYDVLLVDTAGRLKEITSALGIHFIYKSSYDKANRSSTASFRGPGMEQGLEILAKVRREIGVPVLTDVHDIPEIEAAAAAVDVLQTPAFLCRQTDFIQAVVAAGKPVNIKKGQFLAPWDMKNVVDKALAAGGKDRILVCERGVSFGYNNLVSDMRALAILRETGCPVVFDATHSVQLPGGQGSRSGGSCRRLAARAGARPRLPRQPRPRGARREDPAAAVREPPDQGWIPGHHPRSAAHRGRRRQRGHVGRGQVADDAAELRQGRLRPVRQEPAAAQREVQPHAGVRPGVRRHQPPAGRHRRRARRGRDAGRRALHGQAQRPRGRRGVRRMSTDVRAETGPTSRRHGTSSRGARHRGESRVDSRRGEC